MRILFLSNFYPPLRAGGYAQLCQEVALGLQARGHTVSILTSRYQREQAPVNEQGVNRLLHLEGDLLYYRPISFFINWRKQQRENRATLRQIVNDFEPDVIMVWGMWALSKSLPALAERLLPSRVVYYLADYWPITEDMHTTYWRSHPRQWLVRLPKQILASIALAILSKEEQPTLKFDYALCVSATLRDILIKKEAPLQQAQVVYNGIKIEQFIDNRQGDVEYKNGTLKLLYAGQLVYHKGVHTAIEAMANLVHERGFDQVTLTILGTGHPNYEASLLALVDREKLHNHVTFRSPVPRDEMPDILRQFDVLIFPSIYEEPLARMTQEAMASGLVVVGTTTGGTKEILVEGQNGLTFAPEDAEGLANQIGRLVADPDLCRRLVEVGRQTVQEKFTLDRMVDEVEDYLQEIVAHSTQNIVSQGQ